MKLIAFLICLTLSLMIAILPVCIAIATKEEIAIGIACAWCLVIGTSNQWIQHKLEAILR
jgi:hypothetical protein